MVFARWFGMEQGVTCASLGSHPPAFGLRPLPSVGVAARFASLHLLEGFAHEH
jgi:hypothetical protein